MPRGHFAGAEGMLLFALANIVGNHVQIAGRLTSCTVSYILVYRPAAWTSRQATRERLADQVTQCRDRVGHMTLRATGYREVGNPRVRQPFVVERRFFWRLASDSVR